MLSEKGTHSEPATTLELESTLGLAKGRQIGSTQL
jgi:hypothetical protein